MAQAGRADDIVHGHRLWVRLTHWLIALAVLTLLYSGIAILMVHPRLYWGHAGNDLMQPLLEIPLGPNHHAIQFSASEPVFGSGGPQDANRLNEPWNQNGWARSLHFLAAWFFLAGLSAYLVIGLLTGHARRTLLPRRDELKGSNVLQDIKAHLRFPMPIAPSPPYAILQKLAYASVAFVALPLMFLTGITMAPAISANYPFLLDLFGGTQSARTIHFFSFAFVATFLLVHLVMVVATGPARQLRAMIRGH
jgi:thiosulfate reductase cytochrome b subunit